MSEPASRDVDSGYKAKVAEELARADREVPGSERVACTGDPLGTIMLVKGLPGPAEAGGGAALSGADGDAARAALTAMGFEPSRAFSTLSRPVEAQDAALLRRLRAQLEAVDPRYVIALDRTAGADVARVLGISDVKSGSPVSVRGHRVLVVDGLEESLGDERRKRRVWGQLKRLLPDGPIW